MRSSRSKLSCQNALQQDTHLPRSQAHVQKKKRSGASKQEAIWNWDLALKPKVTSSRLTVPNEIMLQPCTCRRAALTNPASLQLVCNNLHCYQRIMNTHYVDTCQHNTAGNSSNCFLVNFGAGMKKKGGGEGKTYLSHAHVKSDFTLFVWMYQIKLAWNVIFALANFAHETLDYCFYIMHMLRKRVLHTSALTYVTCCNAVGLFF